MGWPWAAEGWLKLLLRLIGGVCLLGLVSLWMPRSWIEAGHRWLGWGEFPATPIADYLARSVSALSAFYGGLLVALSFDVRRYAPLVRYQADMAACWAYCVPMLVLAGRVERDRA